MTTTIRLPRRLLSTFGALALILVAMLTAATVAFATPDTKTMTWFLPAGVDPGNSSTGSVWPQTVKDPGCAWAQVDTYRYATQTERDVVDHLADDKLLTLVNGQPEDSAVYLSHFYRPPTDGCGPSSSTTTVPTTSTTTPTDTETTTTWPSPSTTTSTTVPPSTTSSTTTMPSQSTTSSTTSSTSSSTTTSSSSSPPVPPTTSTPPSSTSSTSSSSTTAATPPSTVSPRPSGRPTSVIGKPATGELARTGSDLSTQAVIAIVVLALGLLITGFFVIVNRLGRRTDEDES